MRDVAWIPAESFRPAILLCKCHGDFGLPTWLRCDL